MYLKFLYRPYIITIKRILFEIIRVPDILIRIPLIKIKQN